MQGTLVPDLALFFVYKATDNFLCLAAATAYSYNLDASVFRPLLDLVAVAHCYTIQSKSICLCTSTRWPGRPEFACLRALRHLSNHVISVSYLSYSSLSCC